ncbi:MAG: pantoate--beta-alanine ligase [Solirubrobacteraceae bacterium]
MITVREIATLRAELAPDRRAGRSIGLVPTMGALHDGHLSLIRAAREQTDVVVVSLFVNPAQFDDADDLTRYPRDERRDAELAAELGVAYLFAPAVEEIYPPGFATAVRVRGVSEGLEGTHRGVAHFDGVATIVTKLLNIVGPDRAYFGRKDAQQVAVIERLVRDLSIPVRIEVCPTVRDGDGVALSSRNRLLGEGDRVRARALRRALLKVRRVAAGGDRDAALIAGRAELQRAGIEAEYLEIVDPTTMDPADPAGGERMALVAARIGPVRLIDNVPLRGDEPDSPAEVATPIGASTES